MYIDFLKNYIGKKEQFNIQKYFIKLINFLVQKKQIFIFLCKIKN
jgi:hypothetical protein